MNKRVVVTGVGIVSPLGLDVASTWQGLIAGRPGVGLITLFDASAFDVKIAAEIKGFDPLQYVDRKRARRMDRFTQFAIAKGNHINIHTQLYQHSANNYFYLGGGGADYFE